MNIVKMILVLLALMGHTFQEINVIMMVVLLDVLRIIGAVGQCVFLVLKEL
jgi:hypothetical protein